MVMVMVIVIVTSVPTKEWRRTKKEEITTEEKRGRTRKDKTKNGKKRNNHAHTPLSLPSMSPSHPPCAAKGGVGGETILSSSPKSPTTVIPT